VPPLTVRRAARLTPLPAFGPLYLVGLAICVALAIEAVMDGRYTDPALLPLAALAAACYVGLQQGVWVDGDLLILRFAGARTTIPLRDVRAFTIRHQPGWGGGKRMLWVELLDGGEVRTHVGVSRNLFSPAVRLPLEKMVALVERLDEHRRQVS
jgi:hypothetical protein